MKLPFLATVQATRLPFVPVPALPSSAPSTSVKLPGADGLRIDLLAPSAVLGRAVRAPELEWHAQGVPHYDWLLDAPAWVTALAGGHCVPVRAPAVERLVWHKLYSSAARHGDPAKADKDLLQAATLAAIEVEHHLGHEGGARSNVVAEPGHGASEQADEIEPATLAELFARDELGDEIELRLLGEGGRFI